MFLKKIKEIESLLKAEKLKGARHKIQAYLPGFLKLPEDIIEAVVEFVFLSENTTCINLI